MSLWTDHSQSGELGGGNAHPRRLAGNEKESGFNSNPALRLKTSFVVIAEKGRNGEARLLSEQVASRFI